MGIGSLLAKIGGRKFIKVQAPPVRFVKMGTVTVQLIPADQVGKRCKNGDALACSVGGPVGGFIILPDIAPLTDAEIGALFRHEVAHVLGGWKHETR